MVLNTKDSQWETGRDERKPERRREKKAKLQSLLTDKDKSRVTADGESEMPTEMIVCVCPSVTVNGLWGQNSQTPLKQKGKAD